MTVLFNHEKAVLRYNEETNSIELIWKKFQDKATYKLMFIRGVEALRETKATGWLSDIRNEGVVGPATSKWMQEEILPKAMSYGLKRIAVVMETDIFKEFYVNNIKKKAGNDKMRYFDSIESAKEWLKDGVLV